eukprot:10209427-Lingulodinium_polyedra.AAC.1
MTDLLVTGESVKTLQEIADRQQLRASVEELSKEFVRYTSVTAAAVNDLHQNMIGNRAKVYNELHVWASGLQK